MSRYMSANVYLNYTNYGYTGSQGSKYNEQISGPSVIKTFDIITFKITNGQPNTEVTWNIINGPSTTLVFDSKGTVEFTDLHSIARDYIYTFRFAASGHVKTFKVSVVAEPWSIELLGYGEAPVTVNEGDTLTFKVTAPFNLPDGEIAYLVVSDPATIDMNDITRPSNSAGITLINRTGTTDIVIKTDKLTEGSEYFTAWVEYPAGSVVGTFGKININDTSLSTIIAIQPLSLNYAIVGTQYLTSFVATGGVAPYYYEITRGTLPTGLYLDTDGRLQGIATVAGSSFFTVSVTDANDDVGTQNYTLDAIFVILELTMPSVTGIKDKAYHNSISASGGTAPYTFTLSSGSLPPGTTLSTAGALSGIVTAIGSYNFVVKVVDALGAYRLKQFNISVVAPTLVIAPVTLSPAFLGSSYQLQLVGSGGKAPYTFDVYSTLTFDSQIPPGMGITSTGLIQGIPTQTGTFPMLVRVTDADGAQASQEYSLVVN